MDAVMVELGEKVSCWYVAGVALRRGKGFSRKVDAGNWGAREEILSDFIGGGRRDGEIVVRGWTTGEFFHVLRMVIGSVGA